ncbi:MAG: hypothetical protein EA392_06780 [Cryomorphaceae bacterium]|nr:MAG: hypothetical protein EA392_06780 [Cryomorphaceae bacterium]
MQKLVHILFVGMFSLLLAGGSAGLTLHKMACSSSGKISFSLDRDFCCSWDWGGQPENSISPVCCDFDEILFQLSSYDVGGKDAPSISVGIPTVMIHVPAPAVANELAPRAISDRAPPLPHNRRLARLCTFLI